MIVLDINGKELIIPLKETKKKSNNYIINLLVIYRYRNKSRFNESKVKYIFARKLKIQYAGVRLPTKETS